MVSSLALSSVTVEDFVFSPSVCPPASDSSFFLGGAGVRGLMIEGMFVTFSGIGVYLEEGVVESLATKWQGKSANILAESVEFFRDIVTVPFAKFIRVTLLKPLTGSEFSRKVVGNCRAIFEEFGMNTEEEIKATEKFLEIFKKQSFNPGSSILFKQSPNKSLEIAFTKHGEIPEAYDAVIENGPLSQAVLESMIGRNGVSPATKGSLAARLYELMNAPKATNAEVKPKLDGGEIKE